MIKIKQKGDFKKTFKCFNELKNVSKLEILQKYGERGVRALSSYTPVDTGKTASSWYYTIVENKNGISLVWCNSNDNDGVSIAILLQYGHATGSGGYVVGVDYINPAIRPVFDDIINDLGKELEEA